MNDKTYTKDLVLAGLLLAMGLVLPFIFHRMPGGLGRVALPMHIPILIGGFVLRPSLAIILGAITPLLNSWITGAPPIFPVAITMSFELAIYAAIIAGLKNKTKVSNLPILIIAMVLGRLLAGLVNYIFAILFNLDVVSPITWALGALVTGLPGIGVQIILIPLIVRQIEKYYYR